MAKVRDYKLKHFSWMLCLVKINKYPVKLHKIKKEL